MTLTIPDLTDVQKLEAANITAKIEALEDSINRIQLRIDQNRLNGEAKIAELRTAQAQLKSSLRGMLTIVQT